ncbi:MAG: heme lyase CcmF/NrfE family subunit [Deltaproteobacteria bacterium]|nr:heme lyase CcmF/NrfE family subunit [Deltaproteobacteria bacterium]
MSPMGSAALIVAFPVAIYGAAASLLGAVRHRADFVRSARSAVYLNLFLVTTAAVSLLNAFITRDFSLQYVYEYSSRSLSGFYTISAFWAGQEGSLLLWMWLLAFFTALVVFTNRGRYGDLMPWVIHVLMLNAVFFLLLLNFVTDPFLAIPGPLPGDGYGLNPLLQNPGMVYHPPALFIGYVGLAIPFAFAMASLLAGRRDAAWITATGRWTIISWFFLGAGILLGAKWAYVELGWGGYWAWDPVENASLMPWLTATAFLHSTIVQRKKGMMKFWNIFLVIITYFLVIFGTFITRSGVISSIHAFGKSSLGTFFLAFMVFVLAAGFGVAWRRRELLFPERYLEFISGKESGFILNNIIMTAMTLVVLWGTVLPVVFEIMTGAKVVVGAGYYNYVNGPIAIILLLLMGACPLLDWGRTTVRNMVRRLIIPGSAVLAAAGLAWSMGVRAPISILLMAFSAFVVTAVVEDLFSAAFSRGRNTDESPARAFRRFLSGKRRRYGGYLIHIGIVMIFLGLSGATLNREANATLHPKESMKVGQYTLRYERMRWIPSSDRLAVKTRLKVYRAGKPLGYLTPERRFYGGREKQPISEVAIMGNWKEDLYVTLTGYNRDERASFRVLVNPLVPWLWAGGYIIALGTMLVLFPGGISVTVPSERKGVK